MICIAVVGRDSYINNLRVDGGFNSAAEAAGSLTSSRLHTLSQKTRVEVVLLILPIWEDQVRRQSVYSGNTQIS